MVSAARQGGWPYPVLDAAAAGVPSLAPALTGLLAGTTAGTADATTGWPLPDREALGGALVTALTELADGARSSRVAGGCRAWARRFRWGRTARLLAGVVVERLAEAGHRSAGGADRRTARSDLSTVVRFPLPPAGEMSFRATDELSTGDAALDDTGGPGAAVALLHGCDEIDAEAVLLRQGVTPTSVRLATDLDLLLGPAAIDAGARLSLAVMPAAQEAG
jgi:hypothetical protein